MADENIRSISSTDSMESDDEYRKIHFAVMAIESGAKKLNISGDEMEKRLENLNLIHKRLIGQYEMLHTQSIDYVADDIAETLLNWEKNKNN